MENALDDIKSSSNDDQHYNANDGYEEFEETLFYEIRKALFCEAEGESAPEVG